MPFGTPAEQTNPQVTLSVTHVGVDFGIYIDFPLIQHPASPGGPSTRAEAREIIQDLVDALASSPNFTFVSASVAEVDVVSVTPTS